MRHAHTAAVIVVTTLVAAAGVHAFGGVGNASASVSGGTALQQSTIEGSGQTGIPSQVVVSASGSYEWDNIDAYDAQVTVNVGDEYREATVFARDDYTLDGQDGTEATFANVSGDLLSVATETGYGSEHFMQDFDGESKTETVPVTVRVNVCEYDVEHGADGCVAFTETHDLSVTVHNEPSENPNAGNATVNGSSSLDGHMTFTTPSQGSSGNAGLAVPTPAEPPVGCADGCEQA